MTKSFLISNNSECKWIKFPVKTYKLTEWVSKESSTSTIQETFHQQRYTQIEIERMENGIPGKWKSKIRTSSYISIIKNRLWDRNY